MRFNLDPFEKRADAAVWDALEQVGLKETVAELPLKLLSRVSEYGENFSQGQRQLICLARVLLRRSRVLLLDEATSSVDFETDQRIQDMIRTSPAFAGSTVMTIAHRLNTIIDSDRVLVIDNGAVAEFDTPAALLAQPDSIFAGLLDEMGPGAADKMRKQVAEQAAAAAAAAAAGGGGAGAEGEAEGEADGALPVSVASVKINGVDK